jgi:hypothetical protein
MNDSRSFLWRVVTVDYDVIVYLQIFAPIFSNLFIYRHGKHD